MSKLPKSNDTLNGYVLTRDLDLNGNYYYTAQKGTIYFRPVNIIIYPTPERHVGPIHFKQYTELVKQANKHLKEIRAHAPTLRNLKKLLYKRIRTWKLGRPTDEIQNEMNQGLERIFNDIKRT